MGWKGGSVGKGTYTKLDKSFYFLDPHGRRQELTPQGVF